jgi:hypothetical protein
MMLQHTANHLAAQGRNGDSMLMHVTPHEVAGLQALAQRHGGSLTVNPQTGLPEANFLDDIGLGAVNQFVPAIAGFALDSFLPGAGQAVGGVFGLSGAAGTAAIVGGLAGLSSGSLGKGIMAGLGAYGGASLSSGLGAMGSDVNTRAANAAFDANNPAMDAERTAAIQAAAKPDISAGFGAAAARPMDFLKDNKFAIGAAALPALAGLATPGASPTPLKNTGYIRRYEKNPVTGALEQVEAVPVDQFGDRSAVSFGGVGQPVKYAAGGTTGTHLAYNPTTKKYDTVDASGKPVGPVTFGGVAPNTNVADPADTRSDSEKAYDYLMGKPGAKNPMLFYHQQADQGVLVPADLETRTGGHYVINEAGTGYDWVPDTTGAATPAAGLEALNAGSTKGGSSKFDNKLDGEPNAAWNAMSDSEKAAYFANNPIEGSIRHGIQTLFGYTVPGFLQNKFYPEFVAAQKMISQGIDPGNPLSAQQAAAGVAFGTDAERQANLDAITAQVQAENASTGIATNNPGDPSSGRGDGGDGGDNGGRGVNPGGFSNSMTRSGDSVGGSMAAHGGYLKNGHFEQHMAQGGIAALAGGGLGSLGGYSDGGQLLKGPGDGVSDSIPATIGQGQPARLADGEFVIPARIVSELGNGSTEAGAKQLYAMMARIQAGRAKTTGKNKVATDSKADRHLPA